MIARIISIWLAVAGSALVSFFLFFAAHLCGNLHDQIQRGRPLPWISEQFYPPASGVYWFPLLLFCWALLITFRYRHSTDHCILLCVATIVLTLIFMAAFGLSIALPLLPMHIGRVHP